MTAQTEQITQPSDLTADHIRAFLRHVVENGATPQQAPIVRRLFDGVIAQLTDPDAICSWKCAREYACNTDFRRELRAYVWEKTQATEAAAK